jgi:hypothetical protein
MRLETGTSVSGVLYSHLTATMTSYGCNLKIACATIPCAVCTRKYRRGGETVVCVTVYTLVPAIMNTKWPHGQCWRLLLLEPSGASPPPPTFNRQLMCYETLGILKAVCGPQPVFEPSCVLKMSEWNNWLELRLLRSVEYCFVAGLKVLTTAKIWIVLWVVLKTEGAGCSVKLATIFTERQAKRPNILIALGAGKKIVQIHLKPFSLFGMTSSCVFLYSKPATASYTHYSLVV